MSMNTVINYPPNIEEIRKVFKLPKGVIFTYGNTIYNPHSIRLTKPLLAHEEIHSIQQREYGIVTWWDRYLIDPEWRLGQELEAHRAEYRKFCELSFSREKRNKFLFEIASRLASPLYGKLVTIRNAMAAIKSLG